MVSLVLMVRIVVKVGLVDGIGKIGFNEQRQIVLFVVIITEEGIKLYGFVSDTVGGIDFSVAKIQSESQFVVLVTNTWKNHAILLVVVAIKIVSRQLPTNKHLSLGVDTKANGSSDDDKDSFHGFHLYLPERIIKTDSRSIHA